MSVPVAIAFGAAVLAQLVLVAWLARQYPSIPSRIPYGTAGDRYFLYGPRALVWLAPVAWLLLLAWCAFIILRAPAGVGMYPVMALPFAFLTLATPVVGLAINDKIRAARRRDGS